MDVEGPELRRTVARGPLPLAGFDTFGSTPRLHADRSTSLTLAATVPAQVLPNSSKLQPRPATPRPTRRCRTTDRRLPVGVPPGSLTSEFDRFFRTRCQHSPASVIRQPRTFPEGTSLGRSALGAGCRKQGGGGDPRLTGSPLSYPIAAVSSSIEIFCQIFRDSPAVNDSISFTAPNVTGSSKRSTNSAAILLVSDSISLQ